MGGGAGGLLSGGGHLRWVGWIGCCHRRPADAGEPLLESVKSIHGLMASDPEPIAVHSPGNGARLAWSLARRGVWKMAWPRHPLWLMKYMFKSSMLAIASSRENMPHVGLPIRAADISFIINDASISCDINGLKDFDGIGASYESRFESIGPASWAPQQAHGKVKVGCSRAVLWHGQYKGHSPRQ